MSVVESPRSLSDLQRERDPRVVLFRALNLGDLLCTVPALRALRRAAPGAGVTLVGLPWASAFVERFAAYIDEFVEFPGHPEMPERLADSGALETFLARMRARGFDLAIQMHGSGEISNGIVKAFGARREAGYYPEGRVAPQGGTWLPWRAGVHEIDRYVSLMAAIGAAAAGTDLEFPVSAADSDEVRGLAPAWLSDGTPYVVIHPGARMASRRWPVERFAAVAGRLAGEGMRVAVTGSASEAWLTAIVATAARAHGADLAGATSLGGLAWIVGNARAVVTNDTGMSHVAAAVRTPSVVIASGSEVERWRPLDRERHRVLFEPMPCRPCDADECPFAGHPCASAIGVETVVQELRKLLGRADRVAPGQSAAVTPVGFVH